MGNDCYRALDKAYFIKCPSEWMIACKCAAICMMK